METPISKYLAEDYRRNLGTPDAPSFIETKNEIVPVVIVNDGLPKPNSKQRLRIYYKSHTGASTSDTTISTVTSTRNVYFIGAIISQDAATGAGEIQIQDNQSTGQLSSPQQDALIANALMSTTARDYSFFPSMPIRLLSGLHLFFPNQGATGTRYAIVYYLEEIIE